MKNVLNALDAMLEAYRKKEREFPSYEELAGLLKAPAILVSADPAENEAIARDAQAIVDAAAPAPYEYNPAHFDDSPALHANAEQHAQISVAMAQFRSVENIRKLANDGLAIAAPGHMLEALKQIHIIVNTPGNFLAAAPQVVADELQAFEEWAKAEGLIHESFGIRSTNSMCDVALKAWIAGRAALAAAPVQAQEPVRQTINPMGEDGDQWYFDCDGHYIDVKKDSNGKYSIFFRDRSNGEEAWLDQADGAPVQPVAEGCVYQISLPIKGESRWYDVPKNGYDLTDASTRRIVSAAPAAQGDAKKLTDDELITLARQHNLDGSMLNKPRMEYIVEFARAAIAAKAAL